MRNHTPAHNHATHNANPIPQVIIKWRGKPVFIRHRTEAEIAEANKVEVSSLRDPQTDDDRVQQPEWLVMLGMSYHAPTDPRIPIKLTKHRCLHPLGMCPHW